MKKYKLAVVGATGLVGRTVLKVLEEKNLPIAEYVLFASKKSAGQKIHFMEKDYIVQELTETSFDEGFNFAIFSAGGNTSKKYAPIAVSQGCVVVDNSSAFRMESNVPLVVPEVNPEEIENHNGIIANPNCSTIQAVVALKPLDEKYKIKRVVYSTYQAVSGAGRNGMVDLENGIKNYVTDKAYLDAYYDISKSFNENNVHYGLKKFPHPIFSNCLPHIDVFLDNGYSKEEEKMINETRKILKIPNLKVTATTVRVPVFNCHSESINVEFENDFNIEDLINTLKNSEGVVIQDDVSQNVYPLAIDVSGRDEVFVRKNS